LKKSARKGKLREDLTISWLEELNFRVHTVPTVKYTDTDLFNLWDHVAVLPDKTVVWVQTKSQAIYGEQLSGHRGFPADYKYLFIWEIAKDYKTATPIIYRIGDADDILSERRT
jgi:hypothetical protein